MYNENEQNNSYESHYSYRPDYTEPLPGPEPGQPSSSQPSQSPRRHGRAKRVVAGVLTGVLVAGAAFGGGWWANNWAEANQVNETSIQVSSRPAVELTPVSVDGTTKLTYPEIYNANVDSCVSINVSTTAGYNFFGQVVQSASSGSGFIITADGYIVTNYHVISGGTNVEVTLNDGSVYTAQVIGGDADYDLAVLKIDPGETVLTPVVIGNSENLQVGDEVVAIGNPLGELTFSMSEGIVSCVDREINVEGTPFDMIQITAAVNSGNSGGPLFNIYGEVVGIVSAKYSTSSNGTSVEGLGFAIPINDVLSMIQDIMENGQVTTRPYMGVSVADASLYPETGVSAGAYIAEVVAGGPAEAAGLQVGDVITMINSTLITSSTDLTSAVGSKSYTAGEAVTITFVRDGQVQTTELTFGSTTEAENTYAQAEQPQQDQDYNDAMDEFFKEYFGGRYGG